MEDVVKRAKGLLLADQLRVVKEKLAQNKQGLIKTKSLMERASAVPEFSGYLVQLKSIALELEFENELFEHKIKSLTSQVTASGFADLL